MTRQRSEQRNNRRSDKSYRHPKLIAAFEVEFKSGLGRATAEDRKQGVDLRISWSCTEDMQLNLGQSACGAPRRVPNTPQLVTS